MHPHTEVFSFPTKAKETLEQAGVFDLLIVFSCCVVDFVVDDDRLSSLRAWERMPCDDDGVCSPLATLPARWTPSAGVGPHGLKRFAYSSVCNGRSKQFYQQTDSRWHARSRRTESARRDAYDMTQDATEHVQGPLRLKDVDLLSV